MLRPGSFTSPPMNDRLDQPSYAHNTRTSAVNIADVVTMIADRRRWCRVRPRRKRKEGQDRATPPCLRIVVGSSSVPRGVRNTDVVEERDAYDGGRRDIVLTSCTVWSDSRSGEVFGENHRDATDGRRTNHRQFRPAIQERRRNVPPGSRMYAKIPPDLQKAAPPSRRSTARR